MASVPFQIGPTPNPNSIRIGLAESMYPKALTFKSIAEAEGNELAKALLAIPGVASVFMLNNFVTVNKDPAADWGQIEPDVATALLKHLHV